MLDVIGLGENSIDLIYELDVLPGPTSGKQPIRRRTLRPGGQVATTMAACAALGMDGGYIGAFGNDSGGAAVREALTRRGVDLRHALTRPAPNRYAVILVDPAGERVVLWQRDERLAILPGEVDGEWVRDARAVHVDGLDEDSSIALARMARDAGLPVTSDIETVTPRTAELVAVVTVPIFAESVPANLTGEPTTEGALRALRRHHGGLLVVTLGARGSMMLDGDRLHHEPAFPVRAVDTTGAGDVFRAGFIYGLFSGLAGRDLLRFANAAAAVSCTRPGAIDSVPTLEEVQRLL